MPTKSKSLNLFHPAIASWFTESVGRPTDIQESAWPVIAKGEHALITAPTGSGKTLTAFLWALNQLAAGPWKPDATRVLYVSPLKALNNDIQKNLLAPLQALQGVFADRGETMPDIKVRTRSGDTPQEERRKMFRDPPEILITTPESLNLLLSSPKAPSFFSQLQCVILDEIHSVAATKRGTHLITAVDRLVRYAGEFQRIALSATVTPLETVAAWIGGYRPISVKGIDNSAARDVRVLKSRAKKRYRIAIQFPMADSPNSAKQNVWEAVAQSCETIIEKNQSTLIFTNNRALSEKTAHLLNQGKSGIIAYAHHGSLSKEIRLEVEQRLKRGELKAIVATSSLEMGIDVGALDHVILIQCPNSIASAIQRLGRAGHQVGQVSEGTLAATHEGDLLEFTALSRQIPQSNIESIRPVQAPLDVLAQIIVSMLAAEPWNLDEMFAFLKLSAPYRELSRPHFDAVIGMLNGKYAGARIAELKPRVAVDLETQTATLRKGALQALYFQGGTIPDRGYFHLRHEETQARIGELDEEFVWETAVGKTLTLGTQNWTVTRITHNDVFVRCASPKAFGVPFWKAEDLSRGFHASDCLARFLEEANERLDDPEWQGSVRKAGNIGDPAWNVLRRFLEQQKRQTGCDLPHRRHLVVEHVASGPGGFAGNQLVLHTLWGGQVNRPFALALEAAWKKEFGHKLEIMPGNNCVALVLPESITAARLLSLATSNNVEALLRERLESSGFFAARFRECAGRALLINRRKFNERLPLWLSRLKSEKLLNAVSSFSDFPILIEAWRSCLREEFDMAHLKRVLSELESGEIQWSEIRLAHASPMARDIHWPQVNDYMYRKDQGLMESRSSLSSDLIQELLDDSLRIEPFPAEFIDAIDAKLKRLLPGYAPSSVLELLEWIKERVFLRESEWRQLLKQLEEGQQWDLQEGVHAIQSKLLWLARPLEDSNGNQQRAESPSPNNGAERPPVGVNQPMRPEDLLKAQSTPNKRWLIAKDRLAEIAIAVDWLFPGQSFQKFSELDTAESEESGLDMAKRLFLEWMRYETPLALDEIEDRFPAKPARIETLIEELLEEKEIVKGPFLQGSNEDRVCASDVMETLLRFRRAQSRKAFQPLDPSWLAVFLADHQGLLQRAEDREASLERLEMLSGYCSEAGLWEKECLPARIECYRTACLDWIFQTHRWMWLGFGERQIALAHPEDLDLLPPAGGAESEEESAEASSERSFVRDCFKESGARFDFMALMNRTSLASSELSDRLWRSAWRGLVSNDSFACLRLGIQNRFQVDVPPSEPVRVRGRRRRPGGRTALSMWKGSLPSLGNWFRIPTRIPPDGTLEEEELRKERVRLLLDRYGILFRELLARELPEFQWRSLFRSLRLMELSGEILGGCFFKHIPGLQFISPRALQRLHGIHKQRRVFWINACDPASPCGLPLSGLKPRPPRRIASNHLVYRGPDLVLVSEGNGRKLRIHLKESDPDLPEALGVFHHLLNREFEPLKRIDIETVNGEPSIQSPYLSAFQNAFQAVVDYRKVSLYRRLDRRTSLVDSP